MGNNRPCSQCDVCGQWVFNLKKHRKATGHIPVKKLKQSRFICEDTTNGENDVNAKA